MPRKKLADPYIQWKVNVPRSVAARIELLLTPPGGTKPLYGKRSQLITSLLRQWLTQNTGEVNDKLTGDKRKNSVS